MKFEEFQSLIEELLRLGEVEQDFLDRLPREINVAFFDNPIVGALQNKVSVCLAAALPRALTDEVHWLLYECHFPTVAYNNGVEVQLKNIEDWYDMVAEYYLDEFES